MTMPAFDHGGARIFQGNVLDVLRERPGNHYHCVVTSPPYWQLRSYLNADDPLKKYEMGSEPTPAAYIAAQVDVFREVRRVLHPTGVLFVNIGETYAPNWSSVRPSGGAGFIEEGRTRFKNALRADGWRHRDTIIWAKPSAMPASLSGWRWERHRIKVEIGEYGEQVRPRNGANRKGSLAGKQGRTEWADCPGCDKCRDNGGYVLRKGQWRTTSSHEYVLMFVKSDKYFCDDAGRKEPAKNTCTGRTAGSKTVGIRPGSIAANEDYSNAKLGVGLTTRNPRSVQTWPAEPCKFVHYAAYPSALARFFIKAAVSPKGCCPTCGVPWSPVVERGSLVPDAPGYYPRGTTVAQDGLVHSAMVPAGKGQGHPNHHYENKVHGYRQSCQCPGHEPVPCRVLDPFAGTATTLLAALQLGATADGIELNPDYITDAITRLSGYLVPKGRAPALDGDGPLFPEKPATPAQPGLFEEAHK